MNTNTRFVFALIAAFAAGALVFAPLQSFARGQVLKHEASQVVFQPGSTTQFVVHDGATISIYKIERDLLEKKDKLTLVDRTVP